MLLHNHFVCLVLKGGETLFPTYCMQYFIIHLQEAVSLTNNKKFFLRIVRVLRLLHILTIVNFLIRIDPTKIFIESSRTGYCYLTTTSQALMLGNVLNQGWSIRFHKYPMLNRLTPTMYISGLS